MHIEGVHEFAAVPQVLQLSRRRRSAPAVGLHSAKIRIPGDSRILRENPCFRRTSQDSQFPAHPGSIQPQSGLGARSRVKGRLVSSQVAADAAPRKIESIAERASVEPDGARLETRKV